MEEVSSFWSNRLTWQVMHKFHTCKYCQDRFEILSNLGVLLFNAGRVHHKFVQFVIFRFPLLWLVWVAPWIKYSLQVNIRYFEQYNYISTNGKCFKIPPFWKFHASQDNTSWKHIYRFSSVLSVEHWEVCSSSSILSWCVSRTGSKNFRATRDLLKF